MKKVISVALVFSVIVLALGGLTSCDNNNDRNAALYAEILETDKAVSTLNDFTLRIWISNPEEYYSSSDITIQLSKGVFSLVDANDDGEIKVKHTDFSVKNNADKAYKDCKIKYNGPTISDGYVFGNVTVKVSLESEGEEISKESDYIGFVALGDYVAFSNDAMDSYLSICKKLPGWEHLRANSRNPLAYTIAPTSIELVTYNKLEATIEALDRVRVSDRFDIGIGFIAEHEERKNGVLAVEADGFSILDASENEYDGRYEADYTDLDTEKYAFSGGLEMGAGYSVYRETTFEYTEKLGLVCNDATKRSGEIHISFLTEEETIHISGYAELDIYYATDGKYIAYSVESEDAAKRELYGDFGYFFKVTVPEYFNDLFDGCD